MTDIVKICVNHGPLTSDQITTRNKTRKNGTIRVQVCCLQCRKRQSPSKWNIKELWNDDNPKECCMCKDIKEKEFFHKCQLDRKYRLCKICMSKARKQSYEKYKTTLNPQKYHEMRIRRIEKYGITFDEYNDMIFSQNDLCFICRNSEVSKDKYGKIKNLAIDHCHKTGKVRSLLCANCNLILGLCEESIERLQLIIRYIQFHNGKI